MKHAPVLRGGLLIRARGPRRPPHGSAAPGGLRFNASGVSVRTKRDRGRAWILPTTHGWPFRLTGGTSPSARVRRCVSVVLPTMTWSRTRRRCQGSMPCSAGLRRVGVRQRRFGTDLPERAAGHPGCRGPPARPGARLRGRAGAARCACPATGAAGRGSGPAGYPPPAGGYAAATPPPAGATSRPASRPGVPATPATRRPRGRAGAPGRRPGRRARAAGGLGGESGLGTALRILFPHPELAARPGLASGAAAARHRLRAAPADLPRAAQLVERPVRAGLGVQPCTSRRCGPWASGC